jgi:hypothetical protein
LRTFVLMKKPKRVTTEHVHRDSYSLTSFLTWPDQSGA